MTAGIQNSDQVNTAYTEYFFIKITYFILIKQIVIDIRYHPHTKINFTLVPRDRGYSISHHLGHRNIQSLKYTRYPPPSLSKK